MQSLIVKSRPANALSRFTRRFKALLQHDEGMATAEYAVGILVVIAFGAIVFGIIKDDGFRTLIFNLIKFIFSSITQLL